MSQRSDRCCAEYSAKLKLDRIALLHQDGIVVRRNGQHIEISIEDAVLMMLSIAGRRPVPADGLVLPSESLDIDESLLTGEADPVYKPAGATVLSGTSVVTGNGYFRITGVGHDPTLPDSQARTEVHQGAF